MPLSAERAPSIELTAPDGATARVYLDGAHVTSWIPAGGEEQLFVSANAGYGPGVAIRGGVPVCWPQFGPFGPIRHHGFARLMRWTVVHEERSTEGARAVLRLVDTDETRDTPWPFAFRTDISVLVGGSTLAVALSVTNTDARPFAFTAALHPYFRVRDAYRVQIAGLRGTRYRDGLRDAQEFDETGDTLPITGHLDRVYYDTPDVLTLRESHRTLRLEKQGFPEAVVWNPGAEGTRSRADFVAGDERQMVCVEAAVVRPPVTLAPGAQWTGVQRMIVER
jgi:glucose-6-phosphate 1-epimerase